MSVVSRATAREDAEFARIRWSEALASEESRPGWGGLAFRSRMVDHRRQLVDVAPEQAFLPIERIGGENGWYHADWLWGVRGAFDRLIGGVGARRQRRDPEDLRPGDPVDFWRVEEIDPPKLLRLRAEMKVPGRVWLQFEVTAREGGGAEIAQTAVFDPAGWAGRVYWHGLWPLHDYVFGGMLRRIAESAVRCAA